MTDNPITPVTPATDALIYKSQEEVFFAYRGPLFGKRGRRYIPLKMSSEDVDAMERDRDNLREILRRLIQAKDEKEAHGDTPVYRSLKNGLWAAARNAISPVNDTPHSTP